MHRNLWDLKYILPRYNLVMDAYVYMLNKSVVTYVFINTVIICTLTFHWCSTKRFSKLISNKWIQGMSLTKPNITSGNLWLDLKPVTPSNNSLNYKFDNSSSPSSSSAGICFPLDYSLGGTLTCMSLAVKSSWILKSSLAIQLSLQSNT